MSRYPRFRHAQANPGPFGRRRTTRTLPFGIVVAAGCAAVFAATWFATPMLTALWSSAPPAPEAVAATERSVYYSGCNEARAAGAAPITRGSPGYRSEMDGDNDGIACEPHP
jgi:hypothetical protein